MGFWREPQKTWVRRAIFQIHLWSGIAVGLYIIFISLTGSIVVFRREIIAREMPNVPRPARGAKMLTEPELRKAISAVYPGYEISQLTVPRSRNSAATVTVTKGTDKRDRRFNPFTGQDMSAQYSRVLAVFEWFVSLHDDLLLPMELGRKINAIGGMILLLLCVTGMVIWWRGAVNWFRGLFFNPRSGWKRINFDLHSALGFWSLAILLIWAVSGIYFGYASWFLAVVDHFEPPDLAGDGQRRGDQFLAWMTAMHFGRYGGLWVRITYVIIGFIPPIIVVTGAIMWWNRVLAPWLVRASRDRRDRAAGFVSTAAQISDPLE